ncbi:hypothetical protein [Thauera humireducens]|uniref:hypothetical protein n=1 Tax=Thauera humireducens TaxID=1134435 RepID=UPI00311F7761
MNRPGKAVGIYDTFCYRDARSLFQEVGYALVGPCCLEFARFIAEDARQRGLSRVIFAARDGYLLKAAFDALETGIASSYVRLSRRALYVSSFAVHRNYDHFFEGRVNAADFFSRLGLACPAELAGLDPVGNRARFIHHLEAAGFATIAQADADVMRRYLQANGFSLGRSVLSTWGGGGESPVGSPGPVRRRVRHPRLLFRDHHGCGRASRLLLPERTAVLAVCDGISIAPHLRVPVHRAGAYVAAHSCQFGGGLRVRLCCRRTGGAVCDP